LEQCRDVVGESPTLLSLSHFSHKTPILFATSLFYRNFAAEKSNLYTSMKQSIDRDELTTDMHYSFLEDEISKERYDELFEVVIQNEPSKELVDFEKK